MSESEDLDIFFPVQLTTGVIPLITCSSLSSFIPTLYQFYPSGPLMHFSPFFSPPSEHTLTRAHTHIHTRTLARARTHTSREINWYGIFFHNPAFHLFLFLVETAVSYNQNRCQATSGPAYCLLEGTLICSRLCSSEVITVLWKAARFVSVLTRWTEQAGLYLGARRPCFLLFFFFFN